MKEGMTPKPPLMPLSEEALELPRRYSSPRHGPLRPIVFLQLLLLHSVVTHAYCCLPKTRSPPGRSRNVGEVPAKDRMRFGIPNTTGRVRPGSLLPSPRTSQKPADGSSPGYFCVLQVGKMIAVPAFRRLRETCEAKMITENSDAQPHTLPQK